MTELFLLVAYFAGALLVALALDWMTNRNRRGKVRPPE